MNIINYIRINCPKGWEECFLYAEQEFQKASDDVYIQSLSHQIFPSQDEIFKAFDLLSPIDVKVVIIGQDPYQSVIKNTSVSVANGLAFSTRRGAPIQPSLKTIFKEVDNCYPGIPLLTGDLTSWELQGVLLLNTSLTVNKDESGSHKNIWKNFIQKVIFYLYSINPKIVFVLWGEKAQNFGRTIPDYIFKITGGHPSPLNRTVPFLRGCYFRIINDYLESIGQNTIDWSTY